MRVPPCLRSSVPALILYMTLDTEMVSDGQRLQGTLWNRHQPAVEPLMLEMALPSGLVKNAPVS